MLRVYSPSAEVRGHSEDQRVLQTGKKDIEISSIESVGNYAIRIAYSDNHDTGIYSWEYLYELLTNMQEYWGKYLEELAQANESRLTPIAISKWQPS